MAEPISLLLITHNRRAYLEKALHQLLNSAADFKLYCWDNGSADGVAEIIQGLSDPRVVWRHLCPTNVGQEAPCRWFFENAKSDVIGKIDDDILLPEDWIARIQPVLESSDRFGMLGCWTFMESDYDDQMIQKNIVTEAGHEVLWMSSVVGNSFLARRQTLLKYLLKDLSGGWGLPVDRIQMALDGLISGMPVPVVFAHNMDDPRSPHCQYSEATFAASPEVPLTARKMGFRTAKEFGDWVATDAQARLATPIAEQLTNLRFGRRIDLVARIIRKVRRGVGR